MEKGPDGIMAAEKERNDHGEEAARQDWLWFLRSGKVCGGAKSTSSQQVTNNNYSMPCGERGCQKQLLYCNCRSATFHRLSYDVEDRARVVLAAFVTITTSLTTKSVTCRLIAPAYLPDGRN